jgi:diguanylate cyclase (GGDEF)-like protein
MRFPAPEPIRCRDVRQCRGNPGRTRFSQVTADIADLGAVQRRGTTELAGAARVGGLLYVAASVIAGVLTIADPAYANDDGRVLAMSAFAAVLGALFLVLSDRAPRWLVYAMPPLGGLTLCLGMVFDHNIVIGGEVLLTWPLLAAYMMPNWVIVCTLLVILATFPPIALWILGSAGITPSITMTVTLVITVLVLGTLRRRNRRLVDALHRQAMTDGLTGLPNRRAFTEAVAALDASYALAVIDVDHFKRVNDTAGHAAGDEVLRALSSLMADRVRADDMVARLGGEEFVAVFPGCTGDEALSAAEALRQAVHDAARDWAHPITISVGVSCRPDDATDVDGLLAAADAALYRAKQAGRNRVVRHDSTSIAAWP